MAIICVSFEIKARTKTSSLRDDEKLLVALDIRNLKEERNSRINFYGMAYGVSLAIVGRFSSFTRVLHPLKLAVVKTK